MHGMYACIHVCICSQNGHEQHFLDLMLFLKVETSLNNYSINCVYHKKKSLNIIFRMWIFFQKQYLKKENKRSQCPLSKSAFSSKTNNKEIDFNINYLHN